MAQQQSAAIAANYRDGYREGLRLGGCESILKRVRVPEPYYRDVKVLYIPQGFESIDSGIRDALQKNVRECVVGTAEGILEAARAHRPDLVLVLNGLHVFPENQVEQIKEVRAMGIRTAIWFVDDPYFTSSTSVLSSHYDLVFTHEMNCVSFYKGLGARRVHYMPLAVHPELYAPRRISPEYDSDICFIGNAFWNRVELFDKLAPFLTGKKVIIAGGFWERLNRKDLLGEFIRPGWMAPEEVAKHYNGARIVINLHRPSEPGQDNQNSFGLGANSINPRTYEISACGTLQLTDWRKDLVQYYRPGYDLETFTSAEELQLKLAYYLEHEKERREMAWRGLYTTMERHTYTMRMRSLLALALAE
ncbi:glycosyltransferase [Paenibacillus sp. JX-17]|uniref:Glycosyltransferase n=1 Tax=Paenibacillus lacisoli TaxID=3064525 RepID=A0ABT9CCJ9_9BACL|nr:DUF3880 domain-containing protein [Paenibacillus sp. JX-17]MDO7906990.1 glycosyltransferase [Paenibacillus sp. JX-17]